MRPRCCLRYLTFLGINMALLRCPVSSTRSVSGSSRLRLLGLRFLFPARRRRSEPSAAGSARVAQLTRRALLQARAPQPELHRTRSAITISVAITIPPFRARCAARLGLIAQTLRAPARQNLTFVHPALHADHAVGRVGFG